MQLESLAMFLEVVRTGSFLSAATALGVARPTLRRRIEELEARAGVPLLVRSRQGVVPTEAGAVLASRAQSVLDEATALVGLVREVGSATSGRLRIAAPVGLPPHVFAPFLMMMHASYPKIRVELLFATDPMTLSPHNADAIVTFDTAEPPGSCIAIRIVNAPEQLLASRAYLEEHGTPKDAASLSEHRLLSWIAPDADPRVWPDGAGGELDIEPWLMSSDVHVIRSAAVSGLGIAFVPNAQLPIPPPIPEDLVVVLPDVTRKRSLRAFVPVAVAEAPRIRAGISVLERLAILVQG